MLVVGIGQWTLCGTCRENVHSASGHWKWHWAYVLVAWPLLVMEGPSASNGKDEVEDDDRAHWTAGPNLPVFQDEGLAPQRQRVHGQKWVPIKTFERPVAKAHLLGLCRTRPRPKKAATVAAARRARQQPETGRGSLPINGLHRHGKGSAES